VDKVFFGRKDSPAWLDVLMVVASIVVCGMCFELGRNRQAAVMHKTYELVFSAILVILAHGIHPANHRESHPHHGGHFVRLCPFRDYVPGFFGHPVFPLLKSFTIFT